MQLTGRFAPTPSGRLHLGNILCCMLAWLSVRSRGGRFLLRIEDIDLPRCPASLGKECTEALEWLGFDWDETPVWQSTRSEAYEACLQTLREKKLVYPCFCTRAQLHAGLAPNLGDTQYIYPGTCRGLSEDEAAKMAVIRKPALRVRVPDEEISFKDGLYGLQVEDPARDCGDFVIRRSDGLWGYQLAVVADDAQSGVTEVVRGRDILSSTARQIFLQRALGYPQPAYTHIPLLTDWEGRRLAKRDHDLDLSELSKRMTREEILGMLAFSCGILEENRAASLGELTKVFEWGKVKKEDIRLPADLSK